MEPSTWNRWARVSFWTIVVLAVGFVALGLISLRASDAQADDIVPELYDLYRVGEGRPAPDDVLVERQSMGADDFPTPGGVRFAALTMQGRDVQLRFEGDDQAPGWCFWVDYSDEKPPNVARRKCA